MRNGLQNSDFLDSNGNSIVDAVSAVYDKLNAELVRNSATELALGQRNGTCGIVLVNGVAIDLTTPKTLTLGTSIANLLEGGAPLASTLYNIYLSNLGVLGLSATAPVADGYRTGDSNNRVFGAVYLDASKECAEECDFCGFGDMPIDITRLESTITRTSGAVDNYEIFSKNVVMLKNTIVSLRGNATVSHSPANYPAGYLYEGSIDFANLIDYQVMYGPAGATMSAKIDVAQKSSIATRKKYILAYKYPGSGTSYVIGGTSINTCIRVERSTL